MIDLNDENDPQLFAVTIPSGRLIIQYMEVVAGLRCIVTEGAEPTVPQIARAVRESARTKEVAAAAGDAELFAAFLRVQSRVSAAGNA